MKGIWPWLIGGLVVYLIVNGNVNLSAAGIALPATCSPACTPGNECMGGTCVQILAAEETV